MQVVHLLTYYHSSYLLFDRKCFFGASVADQSLCPKCGSAEWKQGSQPQEDIFQVDEQKEEKEGTTAATTDLLQQHAPSKDSPTTSAVEEQVVKKEARTSQCVTQMFVAGKGSEPTPEEVYNEVKEEASVAAETEAAKRKVNADKNATEQTKTSMWGLGGAKQVAKHCLQCGEGTVKVERKVCKKCGAADWEEGDAATTAEEAVEQPDKAIEEVHHERQAVAVDSAAEMLQEKKPPQPGFPQWFTVNEPTSGKIQMRKEASMSSEMTSTLTHGTRCWVAECVEIDLGDKGGKKMRARLTEPFPGWSSFSLLACAGGSCDLCGPCLKKPQKKLDVPDDIPHLSDPILLETSEGRENENLFASLRHRLLAVRAGPNPSFAPDGCRMTDPLLLESLKGATRASPEEIRSKVDNALTKARAYAGKTSTIMIGKREGSDMLTRLGNEEAEHCARKVLVGLRRTNNQQANVPFIKRSFEHELLTSKGLAQKTHETPGPGEVAHPFERSPPSFRVAFNQIETSRLLASDDKIASPSNRSST